MDYTGAFRKSDLGEEEFSRLSRYIESNLGIRMPPAKKVMLESRLQKRLKQLGMASFPEYITYLFSEEGKKLEIPAMIDVVTTNKTDFFREPAHFHYLSDVFLPEWYSRCRGETMHIWSAACSTGEEPYTIAVECARFREKHPDFDFRILATDISGQVLEKARKGIYLDEKTAPVPDALLRRYFMKSRDRSRKLVRVKPDLRSRVSFLRLNLMDPALPFRERFDVVFCRNVMIYFDRDRQLFLLGKIAGVMESGSLLFLGHSETLTGMDVPFRSVAATVYRKL